MVLPVSWYTTTFPKDIRLKVNVIAQLEFELTYYEVILQHVNHDTTGTPP